MKYLKKFPIFFIVIIVLLAIFVGGMVYNFVLYSNASEADKKLKAKMNTYARALAEDPTQATIAKSEENIKDLEVYLESLKQDLTKGGKEVFYQKMEALGIDAKGQIKDGYNLGEKLRGLVNEWRDIASDKNIEVSKDMDFSYKRYVAPGAKGALDAAVKPVWEQALVLNYVLLKLFDSSLEESPMTIKWVQRETLKEEGAEVDARAAALAKRRIVARPGSKTQQVISGETFKIEEDMTARVAGSLDTIAFRFVFVGHTEILRKFLNQLTEFDAMFVVRSIDVKPLDTISMGLRGRGKAASTETNAFDLFGGSANAEDSDDGMGEEPISSANLTPIISDNLSEFTVVIEHVELVKDDEKSDEANQDKKN